MLRICRQRARYESGPRKNLEVEVLGCGIAIVIGIGCLKLLYNNWRIRKYTKVAADKVSILQEMQHSASVRRGRAKDVPFGVRAIEKGVEVDGIWNSGVTTPAASVPNSPALSANIAEGKAPRDRPLDRSSASVSTITHVRPPKSSSRPPSTAAEQFRGQATYQPRRSSGLRFTNSHEDAEREADISASEAPINVEESQETRSSASWSCSSSNSNEVQETAITEPSLHNSPSLNATRVSEECNPFLTPTTTRVSTDEPVALVPLDDIVPLEPTEDSSAHHAQMLDNAEINYGEGHAQPIRPFDANRKTRKSHVIRKINSGFEILKPGTLDQPIQDSEIHAKIREEVPTKKTQPKKLQRKNRRESLGGAR
ncbi:MAG: hypothetical protein Q9217_002920 [Psora testacea]